MYLQIILITIFLIPAIVSFASTPLVIKFANKIGIVDDPAKNKKNNVIHTYPVPRGGGIAIYLGILSGCIAFLPSTDPHLRAILLSCTLIVILGTLDDKYNLNPYLRLAGQFLIASIPIISGIGIAYITNPINGIVDLSQPQINFYLFGEVRSVWVISDLFAMLWIVFMMNMLNMGAKGIDGQLPGVVVIAALTIAALSVRYSADITQWPIIILAVITAGAYSGFLPWNFYPQKIMPSYSGSTLAGFILAILSIFSTAKVGTLLVVLAVPLLDTGYTIVRRIVQKKSPVWGDRGHLHHKLLDYGWSKTQITLFYWSVTLLMGILALNLNASYKLYTIIGMAFLIGGLLLWLSKKST